MPHLGTTPDSPDYRAFVPAEILDSPDYPALRGAAATQVMINSPPAFSRTISWTPSTSALSTSYMEDGPRRSSTFSLTRSGSFDPTITGRSAVGPPPWDAPTCPGWRPWGILHSMTNGRGLGFGPWSTSCVLRLSTCPSGSFREPSTTAGRSQPAISSFARTASRSRVLSAQAT